HLGFARVIRPGSRLVEGDFEADGAVQLARHYALWMASSPHPGLLEDLFITKILGHDSLGLFRFGPHSQQLVQSDRPPQFSTFRDFCVGALSRSDRMYQHVEIPSLENVPALIFPFTLPPPPSFPEQFDRRPMMFAEWEIVRINRKAFESFLSRLVEDSF